MNFSCCELEIFLKRIFVSPQNKHFDEMRRENINNMQQCELWQILFTCLIWRWYWPESVFAQDTFYWLHDLAQRFDFRILVLMSRN